MGELVTEIDRLERLEEMALNKKGRGLLYGSSTYLKNYKINRLDPVDTEDVSNIRASGM